MSERCAFLLPVGVHAVACGAPAVVILWWPLSRPNGTGVRRAIADTPCCFRHAHEAMQVLDDLPRPRWEWLTTRIVRRRPPVDTSRLLASLARVRAS